MNNKVSIVVPIFNTEKFLVECLNSILVQTYKNIELILINDGSTDGSLDICKGFAEKDNRIIIIDKENTGVSNSRNVGIKKATGEYITFVDSDDWIEQNAIEVMVRSLEKNEVDVVRTNFSLDNEIGKIDKKLLKIYTKSDINSLVYHFLSADLPAYMCLFLIKRNLLVENNLYLNEELFMMEDTAFFVSLMKIVNSICITDIKTYNYRLNLNSNSNSPKKYAKNIENILLVNKVIVGMLADEQLINIANITEFRIIKDFIYKMYCSNIKLRDIKCVLLKLLDSEDFNRILSCINKDEMSQENQTIYLYFKQRNVNKISKYFIYKIYKKKKKKFTDVFVYKVKRIFNKYILRKKLNI
jgi:glycosyltransferase involved in cell wall biosynthesis